MGCCGARWLPAPGRLVPALLDVRMRHACAARSSCARLGDAIARLATPPAQATTAPAPATSRAILPLRSGRARVKVLIADDDRLARTILADLLGELGHAVVAAETGADAVALCARERPDLL